MAALDISFSKELRSGSVECTIIGYKSMVEVEESALSAILSDLQILKNKVDRMESMMESMIEIYPDTFCTVKEEYVKELERIECEGEFIEFSSFEDLRKSIEDN